MFAQLIERRAQFGFTIEPGNAISILGKLVREDLNRHTPAWLLVFGLKHLTYAAFADLTGDLIMAQCLAYHEKQFLHIDSRYNAIKAVKKLGLF
jgi:hypothetical protein